MEFSPDLSISGELPTISRKPNESDISWARRQSTEAAFKASLAREKKENPFAPAAKQSSSISAFIPEIETEKKKARTNHNKRSRKFYEMKGMTLTITESFSHLTMRSKDMGGIFDGVATGNGETRGVQICSHASVSARRKKMQDSPYLAQFISGGNRAFILAWKLNEKGRWIPSEIEVLPK